MVKPGIRVRGTYPPPTGQSLMEGPVRKGPAPKGNDILENTIVYHSEHVSSIYFVPGRVLGAGYTAVKKYKQGPCFHEVN